MYLECDCYEPDHLLVVDLLESDEQPEEAREIYLAEVGFLSNYRMLWYKRVYYALVFIFKKRGYYMSDSVCFSERNINQLESLVKRLKTQRKKLVESAAKTEEG